VHWLVDRKQVAFNGFGISRTPIAVLVGSDGQVDDTAKGSAQVSALLEEIAVATLSLSDVELLDDAGQAVHVPDVLAPDDALLFWNPDCGFCQELEPRLAELSDAVVARAAVIVAGPPRPGVGPGDRWRVLFDPARFAARVTESPGTPSLVRLSDGQPLGPAAIGADAVLTALLDGPEPEGRPASRRGAERVVPHEGSVA
jgi:thiol-disulfide isomerase/thioredoxin